MKNLTIHPVHIARVHRSPVSRAVGSSLCRSHRAPVSRVGNTVLTGNQLWSILLHVLHNAASQVQPETTVAVKHRVSVNLAEEEYRELSVMANKYLVSMAWHGMARSVGDS